MLVSWQPYIVYFLIQAFTYDYAVSLTSGKCHALYGDPPTHMLALTANAHLQLSRFGPAHVRAPSHVLRHFHFQFFLCLTFCVTFYTWVGKNTQRAKNKMKINKWKKSKKFFTNKKSGKLMCIFSWQSTICISSARCRLLHKTNIFPVSNLGFGANVLCQAKKSQIKF